MLLSLVFNRQRPPQPRFAPGLFMTLVVLFGLTAQIKPTVGLAGLGTVAIIAAVLVEFNSQRIWENYRKSYKRRKGLSGLWREPKRVYYVINVVALWPMVAALGVVCLWAAYALG